MKSRLQRLAALFLAAALLAACGSAETIQRVTPLPVENTTDANAAASVSTTVPAVASPTPTLSAFGMLAQSAPPTAAQATPTPWNNDLPAGSAQTIASATDAALQPTVTDPMTFDESPVPLRFSEMYDRYDMRTGVVMSQKLLSLDGVEVVMEGYMAPPLKPALDFFVLTRVQLTFCPFCNTDADWPNDIVLVYMPPDQPAASTEYPVRVIGRLEVGSQRDAETGMVSLVRMYVRELVVLS